MNGWVQYVVFVIFLAALLHRFYQWGWSRGWDRHKAAWETTEAALLKRDMAHVAEIVKLKTQLYKLGGAKDLQS